MERTEMKVEVKVVRDWLEGFKPSTARELLFKQRVEQALNEVKEDFVVRMYDERAILRKNAERAIILTYLHATGEVDIFYDPMSACFKELDKNLLENCKPIGAMAEHSASTSFWLSLPKADESVDWLVLE